MNPSPILRVQDLSARYGDKWVLNRISLDIEAGEIVTLLGPNGAGKSTLIKILLGLHPVQQGLLIKQPGLTIGYVPQRFHVDPTLPMTVTDFLGLNRSRGKIPALLKQLGIEKLAQQPLSRLSGGETQRVLLARAVGHEPRLLVLDEPAQGVDITGQAELYGQIKQFRDAFGCAVVLVSHDLHLVMSATDKVLCLNGHICCAGHPEKVSADPAFVNMFGAQVSRTLSVYHHHHDHHHHSDGSIADGAECNKHD
ncbi:MAG: ATP-binding cassette domain-containing protein [Hahellaceae bacterium]|jgi:zinc transport system ATP-binding protein|nr:ATP-binding cassette domain-containing protein [Hahellaceae bacterium]